MNNSQRAVLVIGAFVVAAMALFPPWLYSCRIFGPSPDLKYSEMIELPGGYHHVFSSTLPGPSNAEDAASLNAVHRSPWIRIRIDRDRFAVQIVGALLVIGLIFFALRNNTS